MKYWLGVFAVWVVPSALWMTYASIQGRLLFDEPGWREVILLAPPVLLGILILGIVWALGRWPHANGSQS